MLGFSGAQKHMSFLKPFMGNIAVSQVSVSCYYEGFSESGGQATGADYSSAAEGSVSGSSIPGSRF